MRKHRLLIVAALGLALAGCSAQQQAQVAGEITAIQQTATQVCSFVPDAAAVAGMIAAFVPQAGVAVPIATQIANAICQAATSIRAGAARTVGAEAPLLVQDAVGQRFAVTGHFVSASRRHRR